MARCTDAVEGFRALFERVVAGPGTTAPGLRAAAAGTSAAGASELPPAVERVIEKIRTAAHTVTDDDVAALRAAGMDEDQVFELTIAAAAGVARRRLAAFEAARAAAGRGKDVR